MDALDPGDQQLLFKLEQQCEPASGGPARLRLTGRGLAHCRAGLCSGWCRSTARQSGGGTRYTGPAPRPASPQRDGPAGPAGDSDISTKRLLRQVSNPLQPQKVYRSHMSIRVSFPKKFYFRFCCLRSVLSECTCPGQYIYVLGTKLNKICCNDEMMIFSTFLC